MQHGRAVIPDPSVLGNFLWLQDLLLHISHDSSLKQTVENWNCNDNSNNASFNEYFWHEYLIESEGRKCYPSIASKTFFVVRSVNLLLTLSRLQSSVTSRMNKKHLFWSTHKHPFSHFLFSNKILLPCQICAVPNIILQSSWDLKSGLVTILGEEVAKNSTKPCANLIDRGNCDALSICAYLHMYKYKCT